MALQQEADEKESKEQLTAEYNAWKEADKLERKALYDKDLEEWTQYKSDFLASNPRRKRCNKPKPALAKRPDTPKKYWRIRPKRAGAVQVTEEAEEDSDELESDECDA